MMKFYIILLQGMVKGYYNNIYMYSKLLLFRRPPYVYGVKIFHFHEREEWKNEFSLNTV